LVSKCEIFIPFFYKYIQVTACKNGILDLSLIKLLQNEQGCNFLPHSVFCDSWCFLDPPPMPALFFLSTWFCKPLPLISGH